MLNSKKHEYLQHVKQKNETRQDSLPNLRVEFWGEMSGWEVQRASCFLAGAGGLFGLRAASFVHLGSLESNTSGI